MNAADHERFETWRAGLNAIVADPFWGMAFDDYDAGSGIHNGLLNGWARYGIVWLLAWISAFVTTAIAVVRTRVHLVHKLGAASVLGLVISNTMFHTITPARNDIAFWIALGFLLSMLKIHAAERARLAS